MRTTAAIILGLALSSAASGADQVPSRQVLADMGLGGMQILSDNEASSVRGSGFSLHDFKKDFYKDVRSIKRDIRSSQKLVAKNIDKVQRIFDSKSHKGGGKRW